MRKAIYECLHCNAFFSAWQPHCSKCGLEAPGHECDDCLGWPDSYRLQIDGEWPEPYRSFRGCDCARLEGDHADWRCEDCGTIWDLVNGDAFCDRCGSLAQPTGGCAAVGWLADQKYWAEVGESVS